MELLLDYTNVRNFFRIVSNIPGSCSRIRSAIAFNSDSLLIDEAVKKKIPLEWWGLFDFQDSTKYELVKKSLEHKDLISFFPVKTISIQNHTFRKLWRLHRIWKHDNKAFTEIPNVACFWTTRIF